MSEGTDKRDHGANNRWPGDTGERKNQNMKTRNLGPLDEIKCDTCGRRHHLYAWPQKCLENSIRKDYADELAYDKKAYAQMSQVERDAYDNL